MNSVITNFQELWNDSLEVSEGLANQVAGQALNGAGALAGAVTGGTPAPATAEQPDASPAAARLQQDDPNVDIPDLATSAQEALDGVQDALNDALDQAQEFVNTATGSVAPAATVRVQKMY